MPMGYYRATLFLSTAQRYQKCLLAIGKHVILNPVSPRSASMSWRFLTPPEADKLLGIGITEADPEFAEVVSMMLSVQASAA